MQPFDFGPGSDIGREAEALARETAERRAREERWLHRFMFGIAGVGGSIFALVCWLLRVDPATRVVDPKMTVGALFFGTCGLLCILGAAGVLGIGTPQSTAKVLSKMKVRPPSDRGGGDPPPVDRWTD
ncbi:MAG: hypothetical protein KF764_21915 [Labilithrix sp.]|nr:hypothetical protein [Labilithrix sp.]